MLYSFVPHSFDSMLLIPSISDPSARDPNVRSLYHISIRMNCFLPSSLLTIIRRGNEHGEIISDFEMGPPGTVYMRGNSQRLQGFALSRERTVNLSKVRAILLPVH